MTGPLSAHQSHAILRLEQALMHVLTLALIATFAIIFVLVATLVIMRYGFNTTIIGGSEATVMMFIYTTALGAAVDIGRKKHIRIDAVIALLPDRARTWLEGLNLVLIGLLHAALLYYSLQWISAVGMSEDPVLHISEGFIEIAIPIGCVFAILFCITRLVALVIEPSDAAAPNKNQVE